MHKHEIVIYWSAEDQVCVAKVPGLPSYFAHGDSPDKALARCQQAIRFWLDTSHGVGSCGRSVRATDSAGSSHDRPLR